MRDVVLNWRKYLLRPQRSIGGQRSIDSARPKRPKRSMRPLWVGLIAIFVLLIGFFYDAPRQEFIKTNPATLSGTWLAAEFAAAHNDMQASVRYYATAHALQPANALLTEKLFQAYLATGQIDKAYRLAELLLTQIPDHRMARLLRMAAHIRDKQYKIVLAQIEGFGDDPFSNLLARLVTMWAHYGAGDIEAARASAQALSQHKIFRLPVVQNTALLFEAIGDIEAARENYAQGIEAGGVDAAHFALSYADFLYRQGEQAQAFLFLTEHRAPNFHQSAFDNAIQEFAATPTPPPFALQAQQGLGFILFGFAALFNEELSANNVASYTHIALWLNGDLHNGYIMLAEIAARFGDFARANAYHAKVPKNSRYHLVAGMADALVFEQAGEIDKAVALLKSLEMQYAQDIVTNVLGDIYRRSRQFAKAEKAYTKLISAIGNPKDAHWKLFFARGEVRERMGDWPRAESDLLKAKQLSNENAYVLNYLGYSWVDHGENLEEGLEMIKKAVAQQPRNGFFVDSLGWAYYRLAQYKLAVVFLEKAAEFEPDDIEIIGHLGDALWQAGRKFEARYQWQRVLGLDIDTETRTLIEEKIDKGVTDLPTNVGPII